MRGEDKVVLTVAGIAAGILVGKEFFSSKTPGLPPKVDITGYGGLSDPNVGSTLTPFANPKPLINAPVGTLQAIKLPVTATGSLASPWVIAAQDPSDDATVSGSTLTLFDGSGGLYDAHSISVTNTMTLTTAGLDFFFKGVQTGGDGDLNVTLFPSSGPVSITLSNKYSRAQVSAGGQSKTVTGSFQNVRVRVQHQGQYTNILCKFWNGGAEPPRWHAVIWHSTDAGLNTATSGITISTANRSSVWQVSGLKWSVLNNLMPLSAPSLADPSTGYPVYNATDQCGIPTDGQDVTYQLAAQFEQLPKSGAVFYGARGVNYNIQWEVRTSGVQNLIVKGNGSAFTRAPSELTNPTNTAPQVRYFHFYSSQNVTFDSVEIAGDQGGQWLYSHPVEFEFALMFDGGSNVNVTNCLIHDVGGDAAYFRGTSNWSFTQNTVSKSRRQGVSCVGGDTFTIKSNKFRNVGRSIVDLESESGTISNGVIENNDADAFTNYFCAGGGNVPDHDTISVNDNFVRSGIGFCYFPEVKNALTIKSNNYNWKSAIYVDPRNGTAWTDTYAPVIAQTDGVLTVEGNGMDVNTGINCTFEGASGNIGGTNAGQYNIFNNETAPIAFLVTTTALTSSAGTRPTIGTNEGNVQVTAGASAVAAVPSTEYAQYTHSYRIMRIGGRRRVIR